MLGLVCLAVLAGILVAGLWPFRAPANVAGWLPAGGGLWFGRHGTAVSSGPFENQGAQGGGLHTVEIWLVPWAPWTHCTLLAFYASNHTISFSLRQAARNLLIESRESAAAKDGAVQQLTVHRIFFRNRPVLIAVTSNGAETEVYVNGVLAAESRTFAFTPGQLTGDLVLATSPVTDDGWIGILRDLAFYRQVMTAPAALRSYEQWASEGRPPATGSASPASLYVFNQSSGRVIRAEAGGGPDLVISPRYTLLHERFLRPPWEEFEPTRHYLKDVLINVGGFVPLGFFFCAFFSWVWPRRRAALITVACGAAVSITIEVLQAYLPTRDSGMTDIITNTLGTAIGTGLFAYSQIVVERMFRRRRTTQESASRPTRS